MPLDESRRSIASAMMMWMILRAYTSTGDHRDKERGQHDGSARGEETRGAPRGTHSKEQPDIRLTHCPRGQDLAMTPSLLICQQAKPTPNAKASQTTEQPERFIPAIPHGCDGGMEPTMRL